MLDFGTPPGGSNSASPATQPGTVSAANPPSANPTSPSGPAPQAQSGPSNFLPTMDQGTGASSQNNSSNIPAQPTTGPSPLGTPVGSTPQANPAVATGTPLAAMNQATPATQPNMGGGGQSVHTMPKRFMGQPSNASATPQVSPMAGGGGSRRILMLGGIVVAVLVLGAGGFFLYTSLMSDDSGTTGLTGTTTNVNTPTFNENGNTNDSALGGLTNIANENQNTNGNVNDNDNDNQNTNTGLFANENGNTNTTNVNSNSNSNQNANTNTPIQNQRVGIGKDTDGDGLTDTEEALIGTDETLTDTDEDSYSDKSELINGYDPTLASGATLAEASFMASYENPNFGYSFLHPTDWIPRPTSSDQTKVLLTTGGGDYFEIMVEDNEEQLTIKDWFSEQFPTSDVNTLDAINIDGNVALQTLDQRTIYVGVENYVFVLQYEIGAASVMEHYTMFEIIQGTISFDS